MKIVLAEQEYKKILRHGEETYPEECCGVLIGTADNDTPEVSEARRMINTNAGSKNTRYNIDPMELLKLEDELDEKGLDMLGIYHSHPDHPAKPSTYDLNHAWPNLSYMVLKVKDGKAKLMTSWRLDDSREQFIQEELIVDKGD